MEENIPINKNKQELWNLSLRDIFYKYIRFLPVFLVSVALTLMAAFLYLRYAGNIYSASGTMLIKNEKTAARSTDKVEDIIAGGNRVQNLQNEIEMLRSRPIMARVVNRLNLQFSYTAEGRVKDMNVYGAVPFYVEVLKMPAIPKPFSIKVRILDSLRFRLNEGTEIYSFGQNIQINNHLCRIVKTGELLPGAIYAVSWNTVNAVARSLIKDIKILPKTPATGILTVSMETTSPRLAADIVNELMIQYDSMTIEQNNYSTDQMLSFIDGRLEKLKNEIDSIQAIELAYRQKENLFNTDLQSENYFTALANINQAIGEQDLRINTVDNVADYVKDKNNRYANVVPSALGLEDITLNELVSGYNKAQLERQTLINSNIPPNNPSVKEAEEIIEKQRQDLIENLKNIRQSYVSAMGKMQSNIGSQQAELKKMPYKLKELLEIQRQISTKLALYSLLEGKREETAISRASTISNSTIIDRAEPDLVPVKPNRRLIQIVAILAGLIIPALVIFIIELMNDKVTTRMDVEKVTDVPIVGEIGHSLSEKVMVVNKTSRGMVAEQFRIIRSNLQYILNKNENPVILVTSSYSGEGKSFVSTNMAGVMALTGKKTVILEFDIRKPKILSGLNMPKSNGISNFLLGKAQLDELIKPVPDYENLFVLPCGPIPPNPAELLLDPKVKEMFELLKSHFEVVIIDTAPVGMVSDAMTLGEFADCTLYLVRQGHTFKRQIALIDELYKEKKLPKVSIIINDVKLKAGYGYYGYGRYGYGYGYGEDSGYYEEEIPKKTFVQQIAAWLNPRNWF
ncbi:MAG: GumC family protein [Chitinophagaceae bacterium]